MPHPLPITALLTATLLATLCRPTPLHAQPTPCDAAATTAEQRHDLPPGLLRAIGQIESGRRNPTTGQLAAWPWAINAEGTGRLFETQTEAIAATQSLRARGIASIDIGCFQINLQHHPTAFPTLEDAFDPTQNADYAARFLKSLQTRTQSWPNAIAAYHSATPERGTPYRDRVLAAWTQPGITPLTPPTTPPPTPIIRTIAWSTPTGPLRIWSPSPPGQGPAVISLTRTRNPGS